MPGGPTARACRTPNERGAEGEAGQAGPAANERRRGPNAPGPAFAFEEKRFAFAFPGHDARGIGAGTARMAARGGAPLSPPLQPPILSRKRGVLAPTAFPAARTPPGVQWGVRAAVRRLSRRSVATDGAGPGDSGFSRCHDAGRPGSAVLSRSAAARPGRGMAHAGAGVGGWPRRWTPASRTSCPEMKSAGVFLPAQIGMVLPRM